MQVTFLIGNGFDIQQGLHTRYTDFLEVYCKSDSFDPEIDSFKKLIEKDRSNWAENWSYFEKELGARTNTPPLNTISGFQKCMEDFLDHFSDYLRSEEERIDYTSNPNELISRFKSSLLDRRNVLEGKFRRKLNAALPLSPEDYNYCFINFNYTNVLDRCIGVIAKKNLSIRMRSTGNGVVSDSISESVHVHGSLNDVPIMGVNDESQIANPNLAGHPAFTILSMKPFINDELGYDQDYTAKRLIRQSQEIWVFGMSLGETDGLWWEELGKWLSANSKNQLVLCTRKHFNEHRVTQIAAARRETYDRFLSQSGLDEDTQERVRDQIHVALNPNLFALGLVFKDAETEHPPAAANTFENMQIV